MHAPPQVFEVDTRYTKLKYISAGAYGMVASADDTRTAGRCVARACTRSGVLRARPHTRDAAARALGTLCAPQPRGYQENQADVP